jgi:hypothetical protein
VCKISSSGDALPAAGGETASQWSQLVFETLFRMFLLSFLKYYSPMLYRSLLVSWVPPAPWIQAARVFASHSSAKSVNSRLRHINHPLDTVVLVIFQKGQSDDNQTRYYGHKLPLIAFRVCYCAITSYRISTCVETETDRSAEHFFYFQAKPAEVMNRGKRDAKSVVSCHDGQTCVSVSTSSLLALPLTDSNAGTRRENVDDRL